LSTLLVTVLRTRGFRNLVPGEMEVGDGITLLWGPNGSGKTNLVEAICLALSGRSCRTRNEREAIAFEEDLARAEVGVSDDAGDARLFLWSLERSGQRRHLVDDSPAMTEHAELRPALAIFMPERLALVKGPPAVRRAHLDRFCGAIWPARAEVRRGYGRALAQRNALLGRIRSGIAGFDSLVAWDRELADLGVELIEIRRRAADLLAAEFQAAASDLGLSPAATLRYVPRADVADAEELAMSLRERRESDLARGYTGYGPHLDELSVEVGGRPVRRYGSQGEQRTVVLALLFAERRALLDARRSPPLMLLDDVMSELDAGRRAQLAKRLAEGGGQAVVTATEPDHLPGGCERTEVALRTGEPLAAPRGEASAASPLAA
jgi:DNA replication and repair protein RecF